MWNFFGGKFLVDPSFAIEVNGEKVEFLSLAGIESTTISIDDISETIKIFFIDTTEHARTNKLRGIAWWINTRMAGEPNWGKLTADGRHLDGRKDEAKRFSFVVVADFLKKYVKSDWSGIYPSKETLAVQREVDTFVADKLSEVFSETRHEQKFQAMRANERLLKELPRYSRTLLGRFVDQLQQACPSITGLDITRTIEILGKLEKCRFRFDLLEQLEKMLS